MQTSTRIYFTNDTIPVVCESEQTYVLKIRDLPQEEKPREKLAHYGPEYLSVKELLAVVLTVGTKKEEVLSMSGRVLKEYGEKAIVRETDPKKLSEDLDIPFTKACQIVASFELGRRFFDTKKGEFRVVRTPQQVYEHVRDMHDLPKEQLRGLYLDAHYRVIHDEIISIGSVDANIVHPREVFKPALERSASAVILVHNHPSGLAVPSEADIVVTKQLVEAGRALGVTLLDHIVVSSNGYHSIPVEYV
jgi:DNA repair protein RadC